MFVNGLDKESRGENCGAGGESGSTGVNKERRTQF